jgi:CysZ protein
MTDAKLVKEDEKTNSPSWIPLTRSTVFLLSHFRIFILSLFLFVITLALTWLFYQVSTHFVDQYIGSHFTHLPAAEGFGGWIKHYLLLILRWFFIVVSNIISFYIAFLIAYCVTTPGYALLSTGVEKIHLGQKYQMDEGFSFHGLLIDLMEGCKIGLFGLGVTVAALFINFIPILGQILVFLLYSFYSCLMFIDYPSSRRRWSLGNKLLWLRKNPFISLRLGILPALISLIPVINIFLMALFFPILTVHATLNFAAIENRL